ncbi:MAG: hypothetical protein LBC71_00320 [Oscillospiraceae bacterium]|jgi:hypothetical protein|nr:hypothetical protein [Oscillospiraceae bacterium]
MDEMNEKEIMNLSIDDFRELTSEETQEDNFRRMFQMLGLIFRNQQEIKELLVAQTVSM